LKPSWPVFDGLRCRKHFQATIFATRPSSYNTGSPELRLYSQSGFPVRLPSPATLVKRIAHEASFIASFLASAALCQRPDGLLVVWRSDSWSTLGGRGHSSRSPGLQQKLPDLLGRSGKEEQAFEPGRFESNLSKRKSDNATHPRGKQVRFPPGLSGKQSTLIAL
jgi:hypothetical protein